MRTRAEIGRELGRRLGRDGDWLNAQLALEEKSERNGTREAGQPSAALSYIERELLRAPFTSDELRRVRLAAGIDVLADLGVTLPATNEAKP